MAGNNIENIVSLLKDIIDKDGLSYPADEPYDVYKKLVESGTADRKIAAALLHFLVSGLWENAKCWIVLRSFCIRYILTSTKKSGKEKSWKDCDSSLQKNLYAHGKDLRSGMPETVP